MVYAAGGNDWISGGNGLDTIYGQAGDDTIWGDAKDALDTGNAKDLLYGGDGRDTIYGGNGADVIYGDNEAAGEFAVADVVYNDTIYGDNGGDRIVGGLGADALTGGNGPDVFVYTSNNFDTVSIPSTRQAIRSLRHIWMQPARAGISSRISRRAKTTSTFRPSTQNSPATAPPLWCGAEQQRPTRTQETVLLPGPMRFGRTIPTASSMPTSMVTARLI